MLLLSGVVFFIFLNQTMKSLLAVLLSGDREFEGTDSNMLNQELHFYSLYPAVYEQHLKKNGFEILLKESDQDQHRVWIAKKND